MNRILAQYLAHVATAAEHAPFGTPGVWQVNYFFNNSLVWAASSVANAQRAYDLESTESNHERLKKSFVRLHTVAAICNEYASSVALPKLELPHVQRYLGLDKEPDTTKLIESAKTAAKLAVQTALIMGRNSNGLYGKTYLAKLAEMDKQRSQRLGLLNDVYSLVHIEADETMYDENEVERFVEDMESTLLSVARANWLYTRTQLADDSLQMFRVEKYNRVAAAHLGCQTFLNDQGVTTEALTEWVGKLHTFAAKEAATYERTLEDAADIAAKEEQSFLAQQDAEAALEDAAHRAPRLIKSEARAKREAESTAAAQARKDEDAAIAAKKQARSTKRTSNKVMAEALKKAGAATATA